MDSLIARVEELRESEVASVVGKRVREFERLGRASENKVFSELCFCILTANFNAERTIRIQNEVGNGFSNLSESQLSAKLKGLGHRFPNARAKYIVSARKLKSELKSVLASESGEQLRDWLVSNVKGLGLKEASHFLRNIGFTDYAILDFHIIDVLAEHKLIRRPKTLSKKNYLRIEGKLRELSSKLGLRLSELDLYLWYLETGKILK